MDFNRGMIGVAIILVSLFGSVALGVVTSIDTKTVTKDVDEYVADITGGFTSEKEQSYITYNTSANYNGYTNSTYKYRYPVDFESSINTNNYPFTYKTGATSSTFTNMEDFQTSGDNSNNTFAGYTDQYPIWKSTLNPPYTYWGQDRTSVEQWIMGPEETNSHQTRNEKSFYNVMQECIADATSLLGVAPKYIRMTIDGIVMKETVSTLSLEGYPDTYHNRDIWYLSNPIYLASQSGSSGVPIPASKTSTFYTEEYLKDIGLGGHITTMIEYNVNTNIATTYINGNLVKEDTIGTYSRHTLCYGEQIATSLNVYSPGQQVSERKETVLPNGSNSDLSIEYITDIKRAYLDTRYGVGIPDESTVIWSNTQRNGQTTIALSVWDKDTKTFFDNGDSCINTVYLRYYNTTQMDKIVISREGYHTYVSLNDAPHIDIGTWEQIQIVIDNIRGDVTITPIQRWDNFDNYTLSAISIKIGNVIKANLTSMEWTAENSLRLGVTDTMVFFNTYGVTMIDPHITVSDLWPNYNRFLLKLDKIATIGNSITIGDTTYPISQKNIVIGNSTIDITNAELDYVKKGDGWEITLTSNKSSETITAPNTFIQFNGLWYFNVGFYDVVSKQVQERVWDIWSYSWVESNMFFWMMLIIALLSIVAYKMQLLDGMSIGILIGAEVLLMLIGGTT